MEARSFFIRGRRIFPRLKYLRNKSMRPVNFLSEAFMAAETELRAARSSSSVETSRSPNTVMATVRGIGVADITSRCGFSPFSASVLSVSTHTCPFYLHKKSKIKWLTLPKITLIPHLKLTKITNIIMIKPRNKVLDFLVWNVIKISGPFRKRPKGK